MNDSAVTRNFRFQFLKVFQAKNGNLNKQLYVGSIVRGIFRRNMFFLLRENNPDLSYKKLSVLLQKALEKETMPTYLDLTKKEMGDELSSKNFLTSLNQKDLKKYDFIFMSQIAHSRYDDGQKLKVFHSKRQKSLAKQKGTFIDSEKENIFIEIAEFLSKSGYLMLSSIGRGVLDDKFEGLLNNLGLYINAIYQETPSSSLRRETIAIISKNNSDLIYVANLDFEDSFNVKYPSELDTKDLGSVSYYDSKAPKENINKMLEGITKYKNQMIYRDFDDQKYEIPTLDLIGLPVNESWQKISYDMSSKMPESSFFHIQILDKREITNKEAQLKKSQILYLLRQSPRVHAYASLGKNLGSNEEIFIYLDPKYIEPCIQNFFLETDNQNEEKNLKNGYCIERKDFYTLDQLRSQDEAEKNIFFYYQGYKETFLESLVDLNEEDHGDLFVQKIGKFMRRGTDEKGALLAIRKEMPFQSFVEEKFAFYFEKTHGSILSSRFQSHCLFYIKNKSVAKYLEIFLNSNLGRQIYSANMKFKSIKRNQLSTKDFLKLKILIPHKDELLQTIKAHEKITKLEQSVKDLHKSFSKNPRGTISKRLDMLDDMLSVAGKLNKSDLIFSTIRGDEKGDAEFKSSWKLPINTDGTPGNRKDEKFESTSIATEATVLKVICSFINTRGGRLIIGVNDEREIIGLKQELKEFYGKNHKSLAKQKDAFDLDFGQALRTYFKLDFIGQENNITSEFVEIEGTNDLVYLVICTPSVNPCVIKKVIKGKRGKKITEELKQKEYFIRKKSESISLDGTKKMDYITDRISNANTED